MMSESKYCDDCGVLLSCDNPENINICAACGRGKFTNGQLREYVKLYGNRSDAEAHIICSLIAENERLNHAVFELNDMWGTDEQDPYKLLKDIMNSLPDAIGQLDTEIHRLKKQAEMDKETYRVGVNAGADAIRQLKTQLESAEKVVKAANEMEKILASVWRECDTTALRDGEKHVSFTIESIGAMRTIQTLYQKALANYDNLRGNNE